MYLIPISVPIFVEGDQTFVGTEWKRALTLLRDSLQGRFGPLHVLAPGVSVSLVQEQVLETCTLADDGIALTPSFDPALSLAPYWRSGAHAQWMRQFAVLAAQARVVHGMVDDAFRPFCWSALRQAVQRRIPAITVLDQDIVLRLQERQRELKGLRRVEVGLHAALYRQQALWACRHTQLALLKGRTTLQRYAHAAATAHAIEDTSFRESEIVEGSRVQRRTASLIAREGPLRLVFCGRLVAIKGVDLSLRIVAKAIAAGAQLSFDIIGGGPEFDALRAQAQALGIASRVNFHGAMPYGPVLIGLMAESHALLFTPLIDETPRMIFDGYAAGLPLVGRAIEYVRQRAQAEGAAVLLPADIRQEDEAAAVLVALERDRQRLADLTPKALAAAHEHSAESWYARRAEWTFEAVDRFQAQA